jgi:CHAT domain-containing protein
MILGPVAEKIKGKRLIVVPDGKLNYFPISALPMPGSESDDPILLTNEVIYQPSAQTYALLKKIGKGRKDERTRDLLVFSDPVFNPADERLTGVEVAAEKPDEQQYRFRLVESFSSLSRLPASKTEAETVSSAVGGSDLFMGFDATRDRLLNTDLSDYRVVHLATHGFLDPERP